MWKDCDQGLLSSFFWLSYGIARSVPEARSLKFHRTCGGERSSEFIGVDEQSLRVSTSIFEQYPDYHGKFLVASVSCSMTVPLELCNDSTLGPISDDFFATGSLIPKHKLPSRRLPYRHACPKIVLHSRVNTCLLLQVGPILFS